jgi:hypothetical protein
MEQTTIQTNTQKRKTYKNILSPEHLKKTAQSIIGDKFRYNTHTEKLYRLLCEYVNQDKKFEQRTFKTDTGQINFSLKKGLFLISRPGTGKSFVFEELLKAYFRYFQHIKYRRLTVYKLEQLYSEHGLSGWEHVNDGIYTKEKIFNLYIDDIGVETDKLMHYGNIIPFMDRFIDMRYRNLKQHGVITHASSNLSYNQLANRYTKRTFSRMNELFNFIIFDAPDFRMM